MTRYAVIEINSGYIWAVVNARTALEACAAADRAAGSEDRLDGHHYEVGYRGDANLTYDVRVAPDDFDEPNGQDQKAIDTVDTMPCAGLFTLVADEDQ
jgi:hypothetical protein